MDSMKINALYVNGSNPNYTLLCDESIYSDITHIKDQRPDCPMICLYAGRDTVAGLAQFAYLNETARGNRPIKFIYSFSFLFYFLLFSFFRKIQIFPMMP